MYEMHLAWFLKAGCDKKISSRHLVNCFLY
jgi:hypothetical protein